jgi:hypothetical protein
MQGLVMVRGPACAVRGCAAPQPRRSRAGVTVYAVAVGAKGAPGRVAPPARRHAPPPRRAAQTPRCRAAAVV